MSPFLPCHLTMGLPVTCGKLGMSLEGVGNLRVFAIGNYVKQRLLYPLRESIHILVVGKKYISLRKPLTKAPAFECPSKGRSMRLNYGLSY